MDNTHDASAHDAGSGACRELPAELKQALQQRFGDGRFSQNRSLREQHGRDESPLSVPPPAAVVFAESTQDVADTLRLAGEHGVPVIPYGAGTSLEGQLLAVRGGISLDVSRMNRIVQVDADDLLARVQAGVTREELNAQIRHLGLFFPIDPGANATLGGMSATRASGTNAVRYGTMRENILALEVVMASGEIIHTGTRARKSSAGYDLTHLFVGSEGTLGVITEVTVRLHPLPEAVSAAVCSFANVEAAVRATIAIIQTGVPIARVELMDARTVGMVNRYSATTLPETPMLLMEFHGSQASVQEQIETVQAIAAEYGGHEFSWADTPEQRSVLWRARHQAFFAGLNSRPGSVAVTTDVCVPISALADAVTACVQEADAEGVPYFLVGHVGDGNFHMAYLIDPALPQERERAEALNARVVMRAIAAGGTCTGEHGIGLHKMRFLEHEAGAGALAVMRSIKRALDPANIMNPGKIFG